MRLVAPPNVNITALEAHRASRARWLAAILAWLADVLAQFAPLTAHCPLLREAAAAAKTKVARDLRRCVRSLRHIVTDLAFARMRLSPYRERERLYAGATRGHARRARRRARFYRRTTLFRDLHQGSLRQRAERLASLLANLEPLIAPTLKRLYAIWRHLRTTRHALVVTHDACERKAPPRALALADTS
jgi:hypothetical protein